MKVLLTGGSGLLGTHIKLELEKIGIDYYSPESSECDITSLPNVLETITNYKPTVVIHCAAVAKYKIVEQEPMKAIQANIVGTCNIVTACEKQSNDIKLVYISTDHVFDGQDGDYEINDKINPLSKYAKTKAAGELAVRIYKNHLSIRTSFCPKEFPFDTAYTDKWTSQDYVDLISPKIVEVALGEKTGICNVGHKRRSFYELAYVRNKNIKKGSVAEIVAKSKVPILIDTSLKIN